MLLKLLKRDLNNGLVSSSMLLDHMLVVDELDRKSNAYIDSNNYPFYYHLGKYLMPFNVLEFGFGLGYSSGCFLKSCKTVEKLRSIQEPSHEYYSLKLGFSNIRSVYSKEFVVSETHWKDTADIISANKWDLVLLNSCKTYEECFFCLLKSWEQLNYDSYIVVNYLNNKEIKSAYLNFCKIQNQEPQTIETRNQIGLIRR